MDIINDISTSSTFHDDDDNDYNNIYNIIIYLDEFTGTLLVKLLNIG